MFLGGVGVPSVPTKSNREQVSVNLEDFSQQTAVSENVSQGHWGENRLADVVKGTAKVKNNQKDSGSNPTSPRATSPQQNSQASQTAPIKSGHTEIKDAALVNAANEDVQFSTVTLTPPSSPEK